MDPSLLELLREFLQNHPNITTILATVGMLRIINKPLFALLRTYVAQTQSKKDDQMLEKVERSKYYKIFLFALDWLGSIKPASDKREKRLSNNDLSL